jgi:phage terminase small subunit
VTHMAGPLRNVRHERFVQALFEGQNATEAYATAGYVKDDGNATRLRNNPKVIERLTELQSEVAAESKVTVAGLIAELESSTPEGNRSESVKRRRSLN